MQLSTHTVPLAVSSQVDGEVVSSIGPGLLCLVGIREGDAQTDIEYMCVL